jgi:regulator of cell morphogenesis and NO signaling
MKDVLEKTISEFVAEDYRTAQVFKNHKIDFCCNGNRSLEEASKSKKLDVHTLLQEIELAKQDRPSNTTELKNWPLDLLADYIEKMHHRYVVEQIPILKQYFNRLCQVHGEHHPELFEIKEEFDFSAGELSDHMKKEELILFPHIRKMVKANAGNETVETPHFGTVQNPVQMMMNEHSVEGERFARISQLSNNYTPPPDGCNTYHVAFSLLKAFEEDLHLHIHLENNILFPKSIELEKQLMLVTS